MNSINCVERKHDTIVLEKMQEFLQGTDKKEKRENYNRISDNFLTSLSCYFGGW